MTLRRALELGGKRGLGRQFEDAIDVEDDHELAVETVDAAGEITEDTAMIGIWFRF